MEWEKNPGGKRYTARTALGLFRIVRQNTAAGAAPWRATLDRQGTTWRIADVRYLRDAKTACDQRLAVEINRLHQRHVRRRRTRQAFGTRP